MTVNNVIQMRDTSWKPATWSEFKWIVKKGFEEDSVTLCGTYFDCWYGLYVKDKKFKDLKCKKK